MSDFIITIDGPAASGKSTAARLSRKKLGASFLDTGAMYRAVTFAAMESGVDLANEELASGILERKHFTFIGEKNSMEVHIDGNDVTESYTWTGCHMPMRNLSLPLLRVRAKISRRCKDNLLRNIKPLLRKGVTREQ